MISKIDICNMALAHIGQEPISSMEQEDERARKCRLFYESVKDEVLRTHNWGFAAARAKLALLEDEASSEQGLFTYVYPQDCLFIRKVTGPGAPKNGVHFEEQYRPALQARVICCALPQAQVEYTCKIQDASLFDAAFVRAFSLALAADLAITLSGDSTLAQRLLQKYTLALDEARRCNMSERMDICSKPSSFVECR